MNKYGYYSFPTVIGVGLLFSTSSTGDTQGDPEGQD